MAKLNKFLAVAVFLLAIPAHAEEVVDPFQQVAKQYRAANPKPVMPESARKFKVQAEFALQEKRYDQAIDLYSKALEITPWWPEGHYGLAVALGEKKKYLDAMREMKRYLMLAPDGADARAAQDKIYQWESVVGPVAGKTFKDCPDCPEMVELPGGSFAMGSNTGNADEQPLHDVTIAKPFAIGKTEVTQAQWHAVMGKDPSYFVD
ncbi:MAG TPA: SUMF1/EgtB/PvdO family nonheme iron enzyme, partial [Gallionellaceae bacterium]